MDSSASSNSNSLLSAEPSILRSLSPEERARLTDILDKYLSSLEQGFLPQPEQLLRENPDLAKPLELYLASLAQLHEAAAGIAPAVKAEPTPTFGADGQQQLGDFVLLREIGRGGMGVVYEARQLSLGRRVALKVLPFASILDSRQIARFKNEAQAAAQLLHPNIVPVFAVGADRGVHYYAMQYIDGQPLDRAIAQLRGQSHLDLNDSSSQDRSSSAASRTSLDPPTHVAESLPTGDDATPAEGAHADKTIHSSFLSNKLSSPRGYFQAVAALGIQAAEALHAAHGYGVIHRDVKPSNLLLDGEGKLWVTDFGLARFQSDMDLTRTGDVVGTRRYMSPEQAGGQTALVDQRTDVYSLGVTLYELLTLRRAQPAVASGADGTTTPPPPQVPLRRLQPTLPVDLETVVLKAMAYNRDERYLSAQEFADDLRRVLDGKPTVARPPTIADRFGKWTRRHARAVTTAGAVATVAVVGLLVATLMITREKNRAEGNFTRAERNFRQAQDTVDRFGARLAERLADVPGAEELRSQLLQETLNYYRNFVQQAEHDPVLRAELAMTYGKIGTLNDQIGSPTEAIAAHEQARDLFEKLAAEPGHAVVYRRRQGVCENNLAMSLSHAGRKDDARREFLKAIDLQQTLVNAAPDNTEFATDLALSQNNLGQLQSESGNIDQARTAFGVAIKVQERLVKAEPREPDHWRNLAASYNNLAALDVAGEPNQAAEQYKKASECQLKAVAARPSELKYQSDLGLTYNNLGAAQAKAGQLTDAAASYSRAIDIERRLVSTAPAQKLYRRDLAVSFNNLGLAESKLKHPSQAEVCFRESLQLQEQLVTQNPRDIEMYSSLGGIYNNLGIVQEESRRFADAADSYKKAIQRQTAAHDQARGVERYRTFLSKHYYNYGRILRQLGRADEAAEAALARRALWPGDGQHLFTVAEELALSSKMLATKEHGQMTAEECTAHAVATLREAIAAGFEPPADLARSEAFAPLKHDQQFRELMHQ